MEKGLVPLSYNNTTMCQISNNYQNYETSIESYPIEQFLEFLYPILTSHETNPQT